MDAAALDGLLGAATPEREESWRYSRNALRALLQQDFVAAAPPPQLPPEALALIDALPGAVRLVFVNGVLAPLHSDMRIAAVFGNDSGVIELPSDLPQALHVAYLSVPGAVPSHWQTSHTIRLAQGKACVVEHHLASAGAETFAAPASEILLGSGAQLDLVCISELPASATLYRRQRVRVDVGAQFVCTHALAGGRLQRFDLDCTLGQARARCKQRGVFALRGREHLDVQLDVRHAAVDTASDVLWRGVADQRARGILRGAITVAAGADGADAQLQTKNVLLSPHAEIDAQPVLEIHADEVKASHGATVGQLDERALFYLRSRGIDATTARAMLIAGFCREAFGAVEDDALQARLDAWLTRHLPLAGADA